MWGDKAPLYHSLSVTASSVGGGRHAEKAVLPSSGERCVRQASDGKNKRTEQMEGGMYRNESRGNKLPADSGM